MTAALERGEWSAARPGRTLPPGKTPYPFYRRLGGPQGRSGRAENLVPTVIRSRTVQPRSQSLYRLSYPTHTYRRCTELFRRIKCYRRQKLLAYIYIYIYIYILKKKHGVHERRNLNTAVFGCDAMHSGTNLSTFRRKIRTSFSIFYTSYIMMWATNKALFLSNSSRCGNDINIDICVPVKHNTFYELIYQLDAIEYLFVYFQLGHVSGLHAHLQEQWIL